MAVQPPLPLHFTHTFAASYDTVPRADLAAVNAMLDNLEDRHDQPEMRSVIHIVSTVLFATHRIYAPGGVYRITWCYDDRDRPGAIVCITVASVKA